MLDRFRHRIRTIGEIYKSLKDYRHKTQWWILCTDFEHFAPLSNIPIAIIIRDWSITATRGWLFVKGVITTPKPALNVGIVGRTVKWGIILFHNFARFILICQFLDRRTVRRSRSLLGLRSSVLTHFMLVYYRRYEYFMKSLSGWI